MSGTRMVKQRYDYDCGVAATAMCLNVPYGDVAVVVSMLIPDPKVKKRGLNLKQLSAIIREFGFKTKRVYRKEGYLEHATGILGLNGGDCSPKGEKDGGHWVYLKDGIVLDPEDGEVIDIDDYVKEMKCRPATLLTII